MLSIPMPALRARSTTVNPSISSQPSANKIAIKRLKPESACDKTYYKQHNETFPRNNMFHKFLVVKTSNPINPPKYIKSKIIPIATFEGCSSSGSLYPYPFGRFNLNKNAIETHRDLYPKKKFINILLCYTITYIKTWKLTNIESPGRNSANCCSIYNCCQLAEVKSLFPL